MTLPDVDEVEEEEQHTQSQVVCAALIDIIKQAAEDGRLACGVVDCATLLSSFPSEVTLCLLTKFTGFKDAEVQIQHLLIGAFCQENYIPLLHVHDQLKLKQLLLTCFHHLAQGKGKNPAAKPPVAEHVSSFTCVMVKHTKQSKGEKDDLVAEYIKQELMKNSEPFIALPD